MAAPLIRAGRLGATQPGACASATAGVTRVTPAPARLLRGDTVLALAWGHPRMRDVVVPSQAGGRDHPGLSPLCPHRGHGRPRLPAAPRFPPWQGPQPGRTVPIKRRLLISGGWGIRCAVFGKSASPERASGGSAGSGPSPSRPPPSIARGWQAVTVTAVVVALGAQLEIVPFSC